MVFFAKDIVAWFIVLCVGGVEMTVGRLYLRVLEPVPASRGLSHGAEALATGAERPAPPSGLQDAWW